MEQGQDVVSNQAISGGVQGFFLTVLEMYLFIYLLNLQVVPLVSLVDSILYILAIIATPVILGILSYANIFSKTVFIIAEIIALALFYVFTPLSVFLIFVIVSLTSILISLYAGDDFIWHKVLF